MSKNCLSLPHALSSMTAIRKTLGARRPAVFLDYDGTLTPIVGHPDLIKHTGKRVHELRPDLDWHKGFAVIWLLDRMMDSGADLAPIFVGDDVTDEDAFHAVAERGVGVVVCVEQKPTRAAFRLEDTDQVEAFLHSLAAWKS